MTTATANRLEVFVHGTPVPQGSVRSLGRGRPSVHGNAATLLPWRADVAGTIAQVLREQDLGCTDQPVHVELLFLLARPKSAPKSRIHPAGRPDVDKLARAVLDAGTGVAWMDDSQVVELAAAKRYAADGVTGLLFRMETM